MFGVAGADRSLALLAENTVESAFFVYMCDTNTTDM
jgi:hypothetical protein